MKKVWVNRFNPDGSMKPLGEWELKECFDINTHYCHFFGHFVDNASDGLSLQNSNEVSKRGMLREYIGNQRGDGWLYVADGDLPPIGVDVLVWDGCDFEKDYMDTSVEMGEDYFVNSCINIICWQPITPPKFL